MKQHRYTFEEVQQVMDAHPGEMKDVARNINRTYGALNVLRWQAKQFRNGNLEKVSPSLRNHFQKYFTNKGGMQLEEKKENLPNPARKTTDDCTEQLEGLITKASDTFATLEQLMQEIAAIRAIHQLHATEVELEELRAWKKSMEPELLELREFRERAKRSGFGNMLRNKLSF